MAGEKTKRSWPALAHVLVYTLMFFLLATHNPLTLLVIGGTHFLIDRFRLARFVCWASQFLGAPSTWKPWSECTATGYDPSHPAWIAVWLFGGQVTSVEGTPSPRRGKAKRDAEDETVAEGSPLVAFSPYVIPFYAVVVCLSAPILARWLGPVFIGSACSYLVGLMMAFHWITTADDLQEQRDQWHLETYLLAIGLVFLLTIILIAACLPWCVPGFSFLKFLSDSVVNIRIVYSMWLHILFL